MSRNIAIIFAGGSGERMGSGIPKQFIEVEGKPIIIHTLDLFEDHQMIDDIFIACKADYISKLEKLVARHMISKVRKIVPGGTTGQDSIYQALSAAHEELGPDNIVLIHDGVRPCVTPDTIEKNIEAMKEFGSAVTCNKFFETPVTSADGKIVESMADRGTTYTVQAPQTFKLGDVIEEHLKVRAVNPNYEGIIDTCTLMHKAGKEIHLVEGNRGNIKVTTPEDLFIFKGMRDYQGSRQALGLSAGDVEGSLRK